MRKPAIRRLIVFATIAAIVALGFIWWRLATTGHPIALVRVVDTAGKPIAGVIIKPEGLRTKAGLYRSGWYGWRPEASGVPNPPVRTGNDGTAAIPYPKYVFERIETGVLCLGADHPDFVPDRPECDVDTTPPAGSPIPVQLKYWWGRIRHHTLTARPDAIVLKKGGVLQLAVRSDSAGPVDAPLFAQVSGLNSTDTNSWLRPEPNILMTRRLAAGPFTARAVRIETNGAVWFSEVVSNTATSGRTNLVDVTLKRGVTVRGELDASVPRPVRNGRVIAHVWPQGYKAETSPPEWHAWAKVRDDGGFEITSLPAGDLEIVALCGGFVSTNGAGKFGFRYPQNHLLGTNDITISMGMEPTARLEVFVSDDKGKPLKDAKVMTWPNVRYGEWSATILASDCYNSADWFSPTRPKSMAWERSVPDFEGTTDSNGLAVLANLPPEVKEFTVQHPKFEMPAILTPNGRKERQAPITLIAGETNHASVQLEPSDQSPISHY